MLKKIMLRSPLLLLALALGGGALYAQQTPQTPRAPEAPRAPSAPSVFVFGGGNYLGVSLEDITSENMGQYNLRAPRGVRITNVAADSPAARAGLQTNDVILRFDNEEVTNSRKLTRLIAEAPEQHNARLTISRGGSEQQISVTLGNRREQLRAQGMEWGRIEDEARRALEAVRVGPEGFTLFGGPHRRIGVSTTMLSRQLAEYFGVSGGVLITNVTENSPAARAGLRAGDVITQVEGESIDDAGDLSRAINRREEGEITLTVSRDRSVRTVRVTPERIERQRIAPTAAPAIRAVPRVSTQIRGPYVRSGSDSGYSRGASAGTGSSVTYH